MDAGYFFTLSLSFPNTEAKAAWLDGLLLAHSRALLTGKVPLVASTLLTPTLSGADLLAWMQAPDRQSEHFCMVRDLDSSVLLSGYLTTYDAYQTLQAALFAGVAAGFAVSAKGHAVFFADAEQHEGPVYDGVKTTSAGIASARAEPDDEVSAAELDELAVEYAIDLDAIASARDEWLEALAAGKP